MTLREKQSAFALAVAGLIQRAYMMGFEVTLGEAWRSPEEAARLAAIGKGIKNSHHTKRLAIDLNLFLMGIYQRSTSAHQPLGKWWESQEVEGLTFRWGGNFARPDGNHYEVL